MSKMLCGDRRGMTLIEMLVALVVFSIIVAGALSTLRNQSVGFRTGTERLALLQNMRFALNALEKDLRAAGSNVPDEQPYFIYAGIDVFAFNADYATNVANDPFAVYFDPDAPAGTVTALTETQRITVPQTSFGYPDTSYTINGANSPAETISIFMTDDSSTVRADDYALFRQVNAGMPELVSRNLLRTPGTEFFEYYRLVVPTGAPSYVSPVASASLPLTHNVPIHLSAADTAAAAAIDSVRGVRVNFTVSNGLEGADEVRRVVSRLIEIPNAGLANRQTCGDEPILGVALQASLGTTSEGDPIVTLTWGAAVDEAGGEGDVVRYVIWERELPETSWGDPLLSVPSGETGYSYDVSTVESGASYAFALAAQDCTPSLSALSTSAVVTIP